MTGAQNDTKPPAKPKRRANKRPGRKPYKTTAKDRQLVETMIGFGIPAEDVAKVIGISRTTLDRHYKPQIELGVTKVNARVAGFLFTNAEKGNVTAQIFWLKTRARWRETPVDINHSGHVGTYDLSKISTDELKHIAAVLTPAIAGGDPGGTGSSGADG